MSMNSNKKIEITIMHTLTFDFYESCWAELASYMEVRILRVIFNGFHPNTII
jgi:hypothetical protein